MGQDAAPITNVRTIAVLRANALGDYVMGEPALEALRAAYPRAEIVLLALEWHQRFLAGRPGPVDRVVVVPPYSGVREVAQSTPDAARHERFFKRMQRERFDLALQLQGGGRNSNPFVLRLGARVTCGTRTPDATPLGRWVPYIYWQREVARWLEVAALAGARPVTLEPRIAVTPTDQAASLAAVPANNQPLVVLHPGVTDPERRWPAERFAAVGDALAAAGARVCLTGVEGERSITAAVREAMRSAPLDLTGRLNLRGLTGLLARTAVVVANDTGPLHLARAVGTRTAGIYWHFNFINAGPMTQARHRPAISWRVQCPVCGINRAGTSCAHHVSFVADVTADEVIGNALELLEESNQEGPDRQRVGRVPPLHTRNEGNTDVWAS
ncbi:MAG TPA: glycosyltransferase family 9 protein [Ktedonobacterales bacterium]